MRSIEVSDKELILLYMLLKGLDTPDPGVQTHLMTRVEKILYDFMTIEQVENIRDYFHSLKNG